MSFAKGQESAEPPVCAGPDLKPGKPSFALPPGATDCHAHVFGQRDNYGYAADRLYTPPPVLLPDYLNMLDALAIERAVVVQSGVHGTNNGVIVDAIAHSKGRLKGIALIRLLQSGRGWSKLSAPYRTPAQPFPYADIVPFAHALVTAAPDRLVWGTDWPHVMLDASMPNDGDLADLLATWVPDAAVRKRILVDNPARFYGFE